MLLLLCQEGKKVIPTTLFLKKKGDRVVVMRSWLTSEQKEWSRGMLRKKVRVWEWSGQGRPLLFSVSECYRCLGNNTSTTPAPLDTKPAYNLEPDCNLLPENSRLDALPHGDSASMALKNDPSSAGSGLPCPAKLPDLAPRKNRPTSSCSRLFSGSPES